MRFPQVSKNEIFKNLYFLFIVQELYNSTIGTKWAQSTGIYMIKQQFSKNQFRKKVLKDYSEKNSGCRCDKFLG